MKWQPEIFLSSYSYKLNVTESAKTGGYLHKIHLFILSYLSLFCVAYTISVSFIEFHRKFCVYDEIYDKVAAMSGRVIKFESLKIRSNFTRR